MRGIPLIYNYKLDLISINAGPTCSLSPQVLEYKSAPFSHSSSPSPSVKLSLSPKMAHANSGTEQSECNHLDKFQLPLHYHGNTKSHDSSSEHEVTTPLYVLGIPLHKLSRTFQFLVCVFGVMFFYLLYGYTQVDHQGFIGGGEGRGEDLFPLCNIMPPQIAPLPLLEKFHIMNWCIIIKLPLRSDSTCSYMYYIIVCYVLCSCESINIFSGVDLQY